jgi:hypothetical protein
LVRSRRRGRDYARRCAVSAQLARLLEDERVKVLLAAARHAHSALTCAVSQRTQHRCAENLDFALKAFESDDRDTLSSLKAAGAP